MFIVDVESDPEEISHLGDIYAADEELLVLLANIRGVRVDEDFVSDEWGSFFRDMRPSTDLTSNQSVFWVLISRSCRPCPTGKIFYM